ncbi:Glutathione S-transferase, omega [hydrothermal vent metagenome]|uniref:Glutathione S-transferase, omega n=1 Tax=hydrothermal vent metagenome TaxID=652676 RepID=A0A3B0WIB7_9ZZZZ
MNVKLKITKGEFIRSESSFRNWITKDDSVGPSGESGFSAEPTVIIFIFIYLPVGTSHSDISHTTRWWIYKTDYMNETLHAEILFLHDINYKDGMERSKLTYQYNDEINIFVVADFFTGIRMVYLGNLKRLTGSLAGLLLGLN